MKLYKLYTHQKTFSAEDLILNPKEHPDAKLGDVVEIYHPEDESTRLLLQITCFNEDLKGGKSISIESNIASAFNLRTYSDVVMQTVLPVIVALDSVEITFKDQYLGRSEMWRLKSHLMNTCVYLGKKIEYTPASIRCQIYELWSQGDRVASGVITEDTKVVFRSSTSMVYLFIQASVEMWDFDIHGDLYYERVNAFLTDLFAKWKKLGSNHEVTIVLFSRTFYQAKTLDEFPPSMRECLQIDYKGRYYEDFYRVAIQNERNDDWSSILVQLRRLFTSYQSTVLRYHEKSGVVVPPAYNSTAAQGNFLEVLNISLNVFEKHYLDRTFDRTGQLSVVITPGVGVFEVDRELTNITKQRIIDNGVGSDLVCVGEQPLHAVPLLKFHNKDSNSVNAIDDYSMPHWINLSFYSTNKKVAYSSFIPRIKLPPLCSQANGDNRENQRHKFNMDSTQSEYIHNSLFDYDAYDAQIFSVSATHGTCSLQRPLRNKKSSVPSIELFGTSSTPLELKSLTSPKPEPRRKMSDPDIHHGTVNMLAHLVRNNTPNISEHAGICEKPSRNNSILPNSPTALRPGRALINPFAPSHVTIKLTSNRRRWTHIFPKGPTGVLIQQHHYQAVPAKSQNIIPRNYMDLDSSEFVHTATCKMNQDPDMLDNVSANGSFREGGKRRISSLCSHVGPLVTTEPSKTLTLLWGATGEQEWTPALTTAGKIIIGVDWKSLTIPACLPITTDYFPDKRSLHNDYVVSDYTLLPEGVNAEYAQHRAIYRKPLGTEEVFKELISQRLAQGFQLIVVEKAENSPQAPCCGGYMHTHQSPTPVKSRTPSTLNNPRHRTSIIQITPSEPTKEYLLSIGRIFHKIVLNESVITVTRFRPRHPYPPINVDYRYRFQAPQHNTYEVSGVNFTTEKLENFNWNYMDQYICTRGDTDYPLQENLKYWRYRMYLLPREHPATKKILDSSSTVNCDIYADHVTDTNKQLIDEFIRFIETHLNKLKKVHCQRTTRLFFQGNPALPTHLTQRRHSTSILTRPPQGLGSSPFRERLGSNRVTAPAMRPRSGSKVMERTGKLSHEGSSLTLNSDTSSLLSTAEDNEDTFISETKLSPTANLSEIFDAMRSPATGVNFLAKAQSLPSCTFVSNDAINWLNSRIEGQCNAIEILERMRKEGMICHASGDCSKPITAGYYLFYVVLQDKKSKDYTKPLCDLEAYENEWMEVEIKPEAPIATREINVPRFLHENVDMNFLDGSVYKQAHLEIDPQQKSDRIEYGHVRYNSTMTPGYAFELVVQWLTASGPIVYDLIYGWCRKAQQCGFQLVPIPADLLAEPFTDKSDPLRGPIFIDLHTSCLEKDGNVLFSEFRKETWPDRLILFQEAILLRFGFMPCYVETKVGTNEASFDRQYVHSTGCMFILVPSPHQGLKIRRRLASGSKLKKPTFIKRYPLNNVYTESQNSNCDTYVSRHVNLMKSDEFDGPRKIGFLWSWNHMIANKRWKSLVMNPPTEGELFQLHLLNDFKEFCSNHNDRLLNFWDECWAAKETAIKEEENA